MIREFRGKHTHTNEFAYGYYSYNKDKDEHKIGDGSGISWFVKPETIGQYTGLKDKNGTKIFEGDIFGDSSRKEIDVVVFENGCFQLKSYYYAECCLDGNAYEERWSDWGIEPLCNFNLKNDEIIGNIYDNPELLSKE